jgi:hypothetical protein
MGIPDSIRGNAWILICGADKVRVAGKFDELCRNISKPKIFDVIDRDVNRCFPSIF